jgi:hypothetical protein
MRSFFLALLLLAACGDEPEGQINVLVWMDSFPNRPLEYSLTCEDDEVHSGEVDLEPGLVKTIKHLPVGEDCQLRLLARIDDGGICNGFSRSFDLREDETVDIEMRLTCLKPN